MNSFDYISQAYDNSIDWDTRLKQEMPFILSILGSPVEKRILDLACGSGRHAVALAASGAEVIGLDMSETMIHMARTLAQSLDVKPEFIIADMIDLLSVVDGSFDCVICLGNSLSLLPNLESVECIANDVYGILKPGASFIVQVLNFEEIHWTGFRNFPLRTGRMNDETEVSFARLFEHTDYPHSSTLIMSAFRSNDDKTVSEVSTQKVLNLNQRIIDEVFRLAGFEDLNIYSDFNRGLFDRKSSRNMVIRAAKK